MARLREELTGYDGVEEEHVRAVDAKAQLLASGDGDFARQLLPLSERLAELTADQKELKEALDAGQSALSSLKSVSSDLDSAANWGTWDMMGGGLLTTMQKALGNGLG